MPSALSAAARAALALVAPAAMLSGCDKPAPRPDTNNSKPLSRGGASAPAPIVAPATAGPGAVMAPPLSAGLPLRPELPAFWRIAKPGGQAIISNHSQSDRSVNGRLTGEEVRVDIFDTYFREMCADAGMPVAEQIGVIYGQMAYLLRRPA